MLVVGDASTLKVHVHTDEPERATALFAGAGEVSRLDVADMHEQVVERERAPVGGAAPAHRTALRRGAPSRRATAIARRCSESLRRHARSTAARR